MHMSGLTQKELTNLLNPRPFPKNEKELDAAILELRPYWLKCDSSGAANATGFQHDHVMYMFSHSKL